MVVMSKGYFLRWLEKLSNWKMILGVFALYIIFAVVIMPSSLINQESSLGPLDLLFTYTPDLAYQHIESFGESGRASYAQASMIVDTAYPVVYTFFLLLVIFRLVKSLDLTKSKLSLLVYVPLITFICDLSENACIVFMLKNYPERYDMIALAGSFFTTSKWSMVIFSVVIVLVLALMLGLQKFRKAF